MTIEPAVSPPRIHAPVDGGGDAPLPHAMMPEDALARDRMVGTRRDVPESSVALVDEIRSVEEDEL